LRGISFSDVDGERARLPRDYQLHQSSADAERLANFHRARAALAESTLDEIALYIKRLFKVLNFGRAIVQ